MTNIAVFGGSFNPPTLAHSRVVEGVLETGNNVDRIILLPSGTRIDKDFGIQQEKRKLLIDEFHKSLLEKNLQVEVDTYFFDGKNGYNTTTIQEDRYFKENHGFEAEFIYGSDVIPQMQSWVGNTNAYIEKILKKIFIKRPGYEDIVSSEYNMENHRFIEIDNIHKVSSSLAKERLAVSQSVEGILDPKISELIHFHKLYVNNT